MKCGFLTMIDRGYGDWYIKRNRENSIIFQTTSLFDNFFKVVAIWTWVMQQIVTLLSFLKVFLKLFSLNYFYQVIKVIWRKHRKKNTDFGRSSFQSVNNITFKPYMSSENIEFLFQLKIFWTNRPYPAVAFHFSIFSI